MSGHKLDEFRRIFAFDFEFRESRSLEDIIERLDGRFEFENTKDFADVFEYLRGRKMIEAWESVIALRSAVVCPPMIYFLIFQQSNEGGRLFLLETIKSWYSYEKILLSMRSFGRNAGIVCRFVGLCWPL